jgi:hypothetical protein
MSIDWAKLAEEELTAEIAEETSTPSGIILTPFGGGRLASWVKFRGEPAQTFVETPAVFATRWMAFRDAPEQAVCIFHEHTYGQAVFIFREALEHLMYVQVTYPTTIQGRTTPGSYWAGQCQCWRYGGPCPRPDNGAITKST